MNEECFLKLFAFATTLKSEMNTEYVIIIMNKLESEYSGNNTWTQICGAPLPKATFANISLFKLSD